MIPAANIDYFELKSNVSKLNDVIEKFNLLDDVINIKSKKEEMYLSFLEAVDGIDENHPEYKQIPDDIIKYYNDCVMGDDSTPKKEDTPSEEPVPDDSTETSEEPVTAPDSDTDDSTETISEEPITASEEPDPVEPISDTDDSIEATEEPVTASDEPVEDKQPLKSDPVAVKQDHSPVEDKPKKPRKESGEETFEDIAERMFSEGCELEDFIEKYKELYQGRGKVASEKWYEKRARIYMSIGRKRCKS